MVISGFLALVSACFFLLTTVYISASPPFPSFAEAARNLLPVIWLIALIFLGITSTSIYFHLIIHRNLRK